MTTGRIVSLDLDAVGLNGEISGDAIAALHALQSLSISLGYFDVLTGTLPSELAGLTNLRYVSITGSCSISGTLPRAFGKMAMVGALTLGGQDDDAWPLSGTLPTELGSLGSSAAKTNPPSFLVVGLGPNQISGVLPTQLGAWSGLQQSLLLSGTPSSQGDVDWGSRISGSLPTQIGRLSALGDFELSSLGRLSGSVPTQLGLMASLDDGLALIEVNISGTLPTEFGRLTNLEEVELASLPLSGTLPRELSALTQLTAWTYDGPVDKILCPNCPALSGTLPHAFASMTALESLEVQDNHMCGTIPASLGKLSSLESLTFSGMVLLSGTLPPSMGLLTSLTGGFAGTGGLQLSDLPLLSGTLPPSLGNLTQLSVLGAAQLLKISGTLPSSLSRLTAMTDLSIDIMPLISGTLSAAFFGRLINMEHLDLIATALSGTIPTQVGQMTSMDGLHIGWSTSEVDPQSQRPCMISGTIPTQIGLLTELRLQLEVSGPALHISGTLPSQLANLTILQEIYLHMPRLSGSIPGAALSAMPELDTLSMTKNRLSGTLPPELCSATGAVELQGVYLDETRISGTLPAEWGQSTALTSLSVGPWGQADAAAAEVMGSAVASQPLSGTIPTEWAGLSIFSLALANNALHGRFAFGDLPGWSGITRLDLTGNNFSGPLLENCSTLQAGGLNGGLSTLKVGGNNFGGTISADDCLRFLPDLKDFLIQGQKGVGNGFNGYLPSEVGALTKLQNLIAIDNALSGTLPGSLATLPNLQVLALAGNHLSGSLPPAIAKVPYLASLLLGKNGLRGELPGELASNPSLRSLDVSRNGFEGTLPPFAATHPLHELRLSLNRVSGTIPRALLSLPQLRHLELDRNDLSCDLAETAVGGGPLLPALVSSNASGSGGGGGLSLLTGNLIGCPVSSRVATLDEWGASYVCGLKRVLGAGASIRITSPAGMIIVSAALFVACVIIHMVRARPRPSVASSAASMAVKREVELFRAFHRAVCVTCVVVSLAAVGLAVIYVRADSAMQCRYEKRVTAAFVRGGFSLPLLSALWAVLALAVVGWGAVSLAKRPGRSLPRPSLIILKEEQSASAPSSPYHIRLSDDERQPSFRLFCFGGAEDARVFSSALPVGARFHRIDEALPEAVDWRNALSRASKAPEGGAVGRFAVRWLRGTLLLLLNGVIALVVGAAPNVLYVLIESRVLILSEGLTTRLAVMAISLSKTLIASKVVPLLSVLAANWLLPMTLQARSIVRSSFSTAITFFNALCWPMFITLLISPSCFLDALVTPAPVPLKYNLTDCFIQCDTPGSAQCPNAGHLYGCKVTIDVEYTSTVQPDFEWNDQCASIAVSIYGPIYMLMFSYAIIASAVWLLLNSVFAEVVTARLKAYKDRLMPPRPPPEHPPPPGAFARLLARLKPTPKAAPPPVLGLVPRYAVTVQHLAIIVSFGAVYPPVALIGTLKVLVDSYVMPRQLEAAASKPSAETLVLEGVDHIAPAAVFAVLAFQSALLYFVFGPYGLVKLPAATWLVFVALVAGSIGIMLGPRVAERVLRRLARRRRLFDAALAKAVGSSSALAPASEALFEATNCEEDFVGAFEAWKRKEESARGGVGPSSSLPAAASSQ